MSRKTLFAILTVAGVAILAVLLVRVFLPGDSNAPSVTPPTATAPKPAANPIEEQDWQMVSAGSVQAVPGSPATMSLAGGRVTGTTGCNQYTGTYVLGESGAVKFDPLAMTKKSCEGLMAQEQAFTQALGSAAGYSYTEGNLKLRDATGATLATFIPRPAATLVGTSWIADGINNGKGAVTSIAAGSEVTALFAADGKLAGNAGCNNYTATYTTAGDKLTITAPAATKKMCADPAVMEQETAYLTALTNAATFRIEGNRLDLRDANGARQVSYTAGAPGAAVEPPPPTATPMPPTATASPEPPVATATATVEPDALAPSDWTLAALAEQPPVAGSDAFLRFMTGGKVTGSTGCNTFNGTYESPKGGALTIDVVGTTRKACPGDLATQEQAFLKMLANARGFDITERTLRLSNAEGTGLASFTERKIPKQ